MNMRIPKAWPLLLGFLITAVVLYLTHSAASENLRLFVDSLLCEDNAPSHSRLFIMLLLFAFVFVSEDMSCILGGILAASGQVSFGLALIACFIAVSYTHLTMPTNREV